jgi:hypothetical protein
MRLIASRLCLERRLRRLGDVADVGRELHDDRRLGAVDDPACDLLEHLGLGTDREPMPRSHIPWGQPKLSSSASQPMSSTFLMISAHSARVSTISDATSTCFGYAFFTSRHLAEVHLERAVGDELDVVEPHQAIVAVIDPAEAARDVDDRVTERLPHRPAPARVERAPDLVAGVGRRRRRQPEGVRALDPTEVDGQVSHGRAPSSSDPWREDHLSSGSEKTYLR